MTCSTALSADVVCYSWPSQTHLLQGSGYRNQVLGTSLRWVVYPGQWMVHSLSEMFWKQSPAQLLYHTISERVKL